MNFFKFIDNYIDKRVNLKIEQLIELNKINFQQLELTNLVKNKETDNFKKFLNSIPIAKENSGTIDLKFILIDSQGFKKEIRESFTSFINFKKLINFQTEEIKANNISDFISFSNFEVNLYFKKYDNGNWIYWNILKEERFDSNVYKIEDFIKINDKINEFFELYPELILMDLN
jgi:hypothetical protein